MSCDIEDTEKQQAINLFLGVFQPSDRSANVWEMSTDFYMHNKAAAGFKLLRDKW